MTRLKVGLIGRGSIGWYHGRVLNESCNAELVAVADANPSIKDQVKKDFGCDFYTDYKEMLKKANIDAVSICLPDNNHVEPSIAAATAGKHILLEKPMARTVKDCLKIKKACDDNKIRLMVAHVLRFDPGYKRLYDSVKNNELGEVIHISAGRKNSKLLAQRLKGQTSMLFHVGIHDIDVVQWVSQKKITKVYAQRVVNINKKWNSEDCIYVLANLDGNAVVSFEFSWTFPENFPARLRAKLEVYGSKATAYLDRFDLGVQIYKEKDADLTLELTDIIHWPEVNGKIVGDLKYEIDHFCEAILKNEEFLVPTGDAISAVNVIESIFESYEKGIPVAVKKL